MNPAASLLQWGLWKGGASRETGRPRGGQWPLKVARREPSGALPAWAVLGAAGSRAAQLEGHHSPAPCTDPTRAANAGATDTMKEGIQLGPGLAWEVGELRVHEA